MVVLHPEHVAGSRLGDDRVAKALVHAPVCLPFSFVEAGEVGKSMEERPDGGVREPLVVALRVLCIQEHGAARALGKRAVERRSLLAREALGRIGPADPEVSGLLVQRPQSRRQPADAALERETARAVALETVGEAVRHDDEPPRRLVLRAFRRAGRSRGGETGCEGRGRRLRAVGDGRACVCCRVHAAPSSLSFRPLYAALGHPLAAVALPFQARQAVVNRSSRPRRPEPLALPLHRASKRAFSARLANGSKAFRGGRAPPPRPTRAPSRSARVRYAL